MLAHAPAPQTRPAVRASAQGARARGKTPQRARLSGIGAPGAPGRPLWCMPRRAARQTAAPATAAPPAAPPGSRAAAQRAPVQARPSACGARSPAAVLRRPPRSLAKPWRRWQDCPVRLMQEPGCWRPRPRRHARRPERLHRRTHRSSRTETSGPRFPRGPRPSRSRPRLTRRPPPPPLRRLARATALKQPGAQSFTVSWTPPHPCWGSARTAVRGPGQRRVRGRQRPACEAQQELQGAVVRLGRGQVGAAERRCREARPQGRQRARLGPLVVVHQALRQPVHRRSPRL